MHRMQWHRCFPLPSPASKGGIAAARGMAERNQASRRLGCWSHLQPGGVRYAELSRKPSRRIRCAYQGRRSPADRVFASVRPR